MAGLSAVLIPDRNTIWAIAGAAQDHVAADPGNKADGSGCVVQVSPYSRIRNGKPEEVGGYQRTNPNCDNGQAAPILVSARDRAPQAPPVLAPQVPPPQPNAGMTLSPVGRQFLMRQEGADAGTLVPHWPGNGGSGVTIGFGYDMRWRCRETIIADLRAIGIDDAAGDRVAGAARLRGADPQQWIAANAAVLTLTPAQRDTLFDRTVLPYTDAVRRNVRVRLDQNEFAALVSFAYQAGPSNFANSPAIVSLNAGHPFLAMELLAAEGLGNSPVTIAGLRARRRREIELFQNFYDFGL